VEKPQHSQILIDQHKRKFLIMCSSVLGGIGASLAVIPFLSSWLPSAKSKALGAPIQVDISSLEPGQKMTVEWRGKPIWIVRRTPSMLQNLQQHNKALRDPSSLTEQQPLYAQNNYRSINPEYLVLIGICTHLGCSPQYKPKLKEQGPEWPGGFYCPCHGSTFDLAGRVFKGVPAPINLEVPPYRFINSHTIEIG
jgi:ubiquinol-cytochrome c reductase iron-sulfur subunit